MKRDITMQSVIPWDAEGDNLTLEFEGVRLDIAGDGGLGQITLTLKDFDAIAEEVARYRALCQQKDAAA
jgi:hypothetical protein